MTLPEDTILENRYRIDRLLAYGGHGAVYRAFDISLNTPVAIKENFFETPERIAQFKQEALILAQLRHSALPHIIHQFSFESQQYLVMDFIEGNNIWELVENKEEPLDEGEALDYIIQVCQALSYLHQQAPPIIHRDVKPQNIKITSQGQAVLVDFGIAKQILDEARYAQSGTHDVIPHYSSPEQYSGTGISPISDIYALGATLYAVLTGEEPPNSISRLTRDIKLKPPDVINPNLNTKIAQAIIYAMQLKPEDRPQSALHFQQILETLAEEISSPRHERTKTDTLITQAKARSKTIETIANTPTRPIPVTTTHYWLVDSKGLGYPLGPKPLTIGSHPQTDVVIENVAVSPIHARIRAEGLSCYIQDEETSQGTFLNGHRLQSEWYPFNPGDVVVIGPTRFYLTATEPARLAPLKPKATPMSQNQSVSAPTVASQPVVPPSPLAKSRGIPRFILALLVIVLAGAAVGLYLLLNPEILSSLSISFSNQADTTSQQTPVPDQTQTAAAITIETLEAAVQSTSQAKEAVEATNQVAINDATRQSQETATVQAMPKATPTPEIIPISTATSTSLPIININTLVPTQVLPTATPTPIPTRRPTPTVSGPTLIPLSSRVAIDRISKQEVIDVDINPKNPREVYALVKRDGIYKSSNGGDGPWARVDLDGSAITAIAIDPTNPTQLYAATWNAVLKSTDGGNTWDPKTDGLLANRTVDVIAIHPSNPDLIYAGIGETLVVSTNGGESWTSQGYGAGLGIGRLYTIVIDPFNDDTVYIGGLAATLYKSTDSGQSFISLVNTGKGTFSIAAHPTQRDVFLAGINSGEAGIIRTENGFDFESVSTGLIYGGADSAYSAIMYAPSNPNIVYAGSGYESNPDSKGIFKSSDGGETWESINNGLIINQDTGFPYYVKSIVVHPTNPDIVFAATGSGLYKSTDGGANWGLR